MNSAEGFALQCYSFRLCSGLWRICYKRHCYYIAIWSGQKCFNYSDKLGEEYDGLGCASSFIVGKSYYHIGNYSAAKMWLKRLTDLNTCIFLQP